MGHKSRYVICLNLIERDETERVAPKTLSGHALYRSHNQYETRLQFDAAIKLLKQAGMNFDSDPVSRGQ